MKFGVFYEHQLPRPWSQGRELQLFQDALEQVELADRLGIDFAWEVEHHFLEEYSHSSAPEVFLAAASQRSKRIRLGHGIVLCPPTYNHPARIAERIAALNTQCKAALAAIPKVKVLTPKDPALSAGIICFQVEGQTPENTVKRLMERKVIASTSPYKVTYARLAPSLVNDEHQVEAAVRAVREIV